MCIQVTVIDPVAAPSVQSDNLPKIPFLWDDDLDMSRKSVYENSEKSNAGSEMTTTTRVRVKDRRLGTCFGLQSVAKSPQK